MKKSKSNEGGGEKSSVKELNPKPIYIQDRLDIWNKLKAQYDAELASKPNTVINVTLPDGKIVEATSWKTTAYDVAKGIRYAK